MPDYRYILLSCHTTEVSEKGLALVLLLDFDGDHGGERKCYLLSDFPQIIGRLSSAVQQWTIAALVDMNQEQFDLSLKTEEMFSRYSSLSVGPLRTACSGSFNCRSLSEALPMIQKHALQATLNSTEALLSFDQLLPLETVRYLYDGREAS